MSDSDYSPAYVEGAFFKGLLEDKVEWTIEPSTLIKYPKDKLGIYLGYVAITKEQYEDDCKRSNMLRMLHSSCYMIFLNMFEKEYYRGVEERRAAESKTD